MDWDLWCHGPFSGPTGKIQVGDNFGSSVYYDNQSKSDFISCIPIELLSEVLVKAKDYMTNINLKSTRVDNLY